MLGASSAGRELDTLLEVTDDGHLAAVALVIGDPGSGKSRLLSEASVRSGTRNVMHLAGYEAESAVPLAAASTRFARSPALERRVSP